MSGPAPYVRIRPGYVERGVLYARKAAYADGYAHICHTLGKRLDF